LELLFKDYFETEKLKKMTRFALPLILLPVCLNAWMYRGKSASFMRKMIPRMHAEFPRRRIIVAGSWISSMALMPNSREAAAAVDIMTAKNALLIIKDSEKTLGSLVDNWEEVTKTNDGDAVRRYLGTVGSTSPLAKVRQALQAIQKSADLPDEIDTEVLLTKSEELLTALSGAENNAYSANFADYSGGGQLKGSQFIKKSKEEVLIAEAALRELVKILLPLSD